MPVELLLLVVVAALLVLAVVVLLSRGRRSRLPEEPSIEKGLTRTRITFGEKLRAAFSRRDVERGLFEEIEEALLAADVGAEVSGSVTERVRSAQPADGAEARRVLREELVSLFEKVDRSLKLVRKPAVIVVVGVNGTGKTTTVAKLAHHLRSQGHEPLLGAADTFRAAADTQLRVWADDLDLEIVTGSQRSDPAAVAFDALQAATARGRDVVIVDTAGRLHSRQNLMDELGKIVRVLGGDDGTVDEVLLVVDATVGQNGLAQARDFAAAVEVSGIVLAKLDGTARGGVVIAAEHHYNIPVKFVGVGESVEDLIQFDPERFVDALMEGT